MEMDSLESILEKHLSTENFEFAQKLLFGPVQCRKLNLDLDHALIPINGKSIEIEVKGYSFCSKEHPGCPPSSKIVRVGLFQNAIVERTDSSVAEQRNALLELGAEALRLASVCGVQVFCFQELWNMPLAFCTQKKLPWVEFAEDVANGPTTTKLSKLAKKYNMVIISPILERDDKSDCLWNSAVVISNSGQVLGTSRKNHIPISGRFSEAYYYNPSSLGHPVFQTEYGRLAIPICYDRHHPHCWFSYSLNSAEIVFNPSATVQTFSESLWPIEARDAAIKNKFYTCAINRVGTEHFQSEAGLGSDHVNAGPFFGSSYVAAPDGSRTPGLSLDKNGLLVVDLDLEKCQTSKESIAKSQGLIEIE